MKGYRTLLFNILAAALTVIIGYNWTDALTTYPWAAPLIVTAANVVLRFVTTTPVGAASA